MEELCDPTAEILLMATSQWKSKLQGNDAK
jgi:hypothetical protein